MHTAPHASPSPEPVASAVAGESRGYPYTAVLLAMNERAQARARAAGEDLRPHQEQRHALHRRAIRESGAVVVTFVSEVGS